MAYYLIGHPLGHSFSPRLHALYGNPDYRLMDLDREELDRFMAEGAFDGLNVTIPYKQTVIPFCAELTDRARAIGAVNTIRRMKDGRLLGDNTDIVGLYRMAERAGVSFENRKVLILGTGGTGHTARYAAEAGGARNTVFVSRSGPVHYQNVYTLHPDAQVIINTTPAGMFPGQYADPPVDLDRFNAPEAVLDVIYNPLRTRLTLEAEKRGILFCNGLWMLTEQARASAELFFDRAIPDEDAERAYQALRKERINLVLIGMPGSGKTTMGRLLSRALNRPFLDTDTMLVQKVQMEIPEIFEKMGESGFRDLETETIREACAQGGQIIATGGGAVLREENRDAMRMNGYICLIDRPVEQLDRAGRPLSQSTRVLEKMKETRMPYYLSLADAVFENNDSPETLAKAMMEDFYAHFGTERA